MFRYCIFDLDGTLTNPRVGITTCVQYALQHFGVFASNLNTLESFIGPPLKDSFVEFYGFSEEQAKSAVNIYRERYGTLGIFENEVYEGIPELLRCLKTSGVKLAVASSKPYVYVKQILEHFDIDELFDVVVGSELDGTNSSKGKVIEAALCQLGICNLSYSEKKKKCAMIGDRKFDIIAAKSYGLFSVGVRYGFASLGEMEAENPDYICETVAELSDFLVHT